MTAMNTAVLASIFLSLSCFTSPASAIYKCEQDDVITYTDIPCDGQELSVTVPQKSRSADEKSDDKLLAREKKEVEKLQAIREQRERQDKQIRDLSARGAAARERQVAGAATKMARRRFARGASD